MKQMSFALTTDQIRRQTKTVTRRCGWLTAKPGDLVQPVVKGQGLKKGEHPEPIGPPIRFVRVSREVLGDITPQDVYREGFPSMTTTEFVAMFKHVNGGLKSQKVTRIEFEYLSDWDADCLTWRGRILVGRYAHWCADWDDLPIDETCQEWPCGCEKATKQWIIDHNPA